MDLSLIIIARDEEKHIARCIESVPFAGEIIVVDSGSADSTVEIAEKLGAKVLFHEFKNFSDQKQWALSQASCGWILSLDADEFLSEGLMNELSSVIENGPTFDAYSLQFRIMYMNRLMRFGPWSGENHIRLFRKGSAVFPDSTVHEGLILTQGRKGSLKDGYVIHEPYSSIEEQVEKMILYAGLWARDQAETGRSSNYLQILLRPLWKFFSSFILKGGFLEGVPGIAASAISSLYVLQKWLLLYEMKRGK